MTSFKAGVARNAGWATLESIAGQGIAFIVFLLLARLLAVDDFGIIAIANIYLLVAQFFIFQGLGQAILQFEDLDDAHLQTVFWINGAVGLFLFLLTFAICGVMERWFHTPGLAPVLRGLSPIFLLAALTDVQNNLLIRRMRFRSLALRTLFSYGAGGLVAVIMALHGSGAWSLVGQQLTVWSINLLALWAASEWRPRLRFSKRRARRLLAFGVHLLWTDLVGLANRRADQVFVGRAFGPSVLGFYAVGSRVATLVNEVLSRSLGRVTVAVLSRLQLEAQRLRRAVYQMAEMQSAVIFPVAVGLALVAPEVVFLFFGKKWEAAVPYMQILLLACPLESLLGLHQSVWVARGQPGWCSLLTSIHAVVNVLIFTVAIHWGPVAVAAGYTLRALLLYPLELALLRRVAGFSPWLLARVLAPQVGATLIMLEAVLLVRRWLHASPPLALLSLSALTGAATYLAALLLLNRRLVAEIWRFRLLARTEDLAPEATV